MLLLTRNVGQSIIIGDRTAIVRILGISGNQVRLGIDADESISIHREEIFDKIENEKTREK